MSHLFNNLLHFGQVLHTLGLDVHAGRMSDVAAALAHIDIGKKQDFYFTLRSLLIHRHQDIAIFDQAFLTFWRAPSGRASPSSFPNKPINKPIRNSGSDRLIPFFPGQEKGINRSDPEFPTGDLSYSSREVSRTKDFALFTEGEMEQARAMLASFKWDFGERRTRRWVAGSGKAVDLRLLLRRNIKYAGEPLEIPGRQRKLKRRPLVVLCDISGSMERYSRMLLHFIHSMAGGMDRVEAFLFATRLTRITRDLSRRRVNEALSKITARVSDWSGGTRIGEALRTFNMQWCRRVLTHGPVVMLISDGWDRGDPELLRREISRLQRTSYRLIWLNPLLGAPDYQPLTRGMQAALPFVDDFLSVHNLDSLTALGNHLNALPPSRRRAGTRGNGSSRHVQL